MLTLTQLLEAASLTAGSYGRDRVLAEYEARCNAGDYTNHALELAHAELMRLEEERDEANRLFREGLSHAEVARAVGRIADYV